MSNSFERKYYMRTSDFDRYGTVLPSAVLDLFQDVAGLHANELGCGYDDLITKQMIWVLVRVSVEIEKSPVMFQQVSVKTWPLEPTRASFRREYLIRDENGRVLIRGASEWVVVHSEKRRMMAAKDVYPEMEYIKELAIEGKLTKIHEPDSEAHTVELKPQFCDIDINGHVNNTKYANFALNAVSPKAGETLKHLQIDYRHELREGSAVTLRVYRDNGEVTAIGGAENETAFACKLVF